MQYLNKIDKLTLKEKSIIDLSNINQNLITQNSFLTESDLNNFYKKNYYGFPLLLNSKDNCFINKKNIFSINKEKFSRFIYGDKKFVYSHSLLFFENGNEFAEFGVLKKKYLKIYNLINLHNLNLIKLVKKLKRKGLKISSFQTRNIPHLGHELIIKKLLSMTDIVIINPVIGPKKKGDFKSHTLQKVYNYLSKSKYDKKIIFYPIIANMHYSGPREALHHCILREKLGFDCFTVGRDHAGSDAFYYKFAAINAIKRNVKEFKIKIHTHKGSYFCNKCKKIVFYENCDHKKYFINISGSDFRDCIANKKLYEYADQNLQKYIHKLNFKLFY